MTNWAISLLMRKTETILSPGTLGQGLRKGLEGVPKKKERKRLGKIGSAACKQARAHSSQTVDSKEVPVEGAAMFHVTGESMLPPKPLETLSGDLRRLHDHVLSTEKSLLASKDP